VIAACIMLIERDLVKYRSWKASQPIDVDAGG